VVTADGAGGTNECAAEVRPRIEARLEASMMVKLQAVAVGEADANSVVVEARKPGARLMLAARFRVKRV